MSTGNGPGLDNTGTSQHGPARIPPKRGSVSPVSVRQAVDEAHFLQDSRGKLARLKLRASGLSHQQAPGATGAHIMNIYPLFHGLLLATALTC